jgi:hypothetical protein
MERGRIAQILGKTKFSETDFAAAIARVKHNDEKATISASDAAAQSAALLVNDNAIPYKGEGYERVLLHNYQALNYLANKNLESAAIEVRLANAEQDEALKRHEEELEEAREEASKQKIQLSGNNQQLNAVYAKMDEVSGKVKSSFQNAYTFYLSGVVYELLNQPNDAYIDYKKALEISPGNSFVQTDVIRLARFLEMDEDLAIYNSRYTQISEKLKTATSAPPEGQLLIFYEEGLVPQKEEIRVTLPIPKAGPIAVAFPIYTAHWQKPIPVNIYSNNSLLGVSEPVCYVNALAVRALKERIPEMVIRQTIRSTLKGIAAKKANDKDQLFGLLTSAYNIVSENADLRSWLTLPANVQIMRTTLPPGNYSLSLMPDNSSLAKEETIEVRRGGISILHVIKIGTRIYSNKINY